MATLTRPQVLDLETALIATFAGQIAVRNAYPIASRIKFPPVPAQFSESIVVLAAPRLFPQLQGFTASAGGRSADVVLSPPAAGAGGGAVPVPTVKIEVKATAGRGTLELKTRDVQADSSSGLRSAIVSRVGQILSERTC